MSQPPAIQLENVSKTFGRGRKQVEAVRQLSLEVRASPPKNKTVESAKI